MTAVSCRFNHLYEKREGERKMKKRRERERGGKQKRKQQARALLEGSSRRDRVQKKRSPLYRTA
jgi:hypothetical protein